MARNYYKNKKTKKTIIAALCAVTVACTGFAAACVKNDKPADKDETKAEKPEDTQLLKNGNFEFYDYPSAKLIEKGDALYLIKTPDNWTRSGDSSNAMSGIISTSDQAWKQFTDDNYWLEKTGRTLKNELDRNNELSSEHDEYVDYNGMRSRDIFYKDTYAALLNGSDVAESYIKNQGYEDYFGIIGNDGNYKIGETSVYYNSDDKEYYFDQAFTKSVRQALISNPGTHYNVQKDDGGYYYMDGTTKKTLYTNEYGDYFFDEKHESPLSNVLMVHNYPTNNNYNGISQYYTSNSVTLTENTAAEISVWVKTSDIKFDKGYSQLNDQDRGAFIEVIQKVGGKEVDSFKIKAINTEKILRDNSNLATASNGWLKYTVFVKACDFAQTDIQVRLGLGQSDSAEKCTGYAFFDDLKVEKFVSLDDEANGCADYKANKDKLTENTSCNLTDKEDDKIFIADYAYTDRNMAGYTNKDRNSKDFYYLIDLASEVSANKAAVELSSTSAKTGLTTEKTSDNGENVTYASATSLPATLHNLGKIELPADAKLPENLNGNGRKTSNDLLGIFPYNQTFEASLFNGGRDYSARLNDVLTGKGALPGYDGKVLLTLSAYGAAYTSEITHSTFSLEKGESLILSFWVKTSDMNGKTAATVKLIDLNDETTASEAITIDTTGKTTDTEEKKDLYNGWVQCFFFVKNDSDEDGAKTFKMNFSFGNTELSETTLTSYDYGWIAACNLQTLKIDDDIYELATSGDYTKTFTFDAEEDKTEENKFDAESSVSNIKTGISIPSTYSGVNGAGAAVTDNPFRMEYDSKNTNSLAGLINREHYENYATKSAINTAFGFDAAARWDEVFGKTHYQPLIIVNKLRAYAEKAEATENDFKDYYIEVKDEGAFDLQTVDGKKYKKVDENATFDKEETYYSLNQVLNYGFIGESKSVSADTYQVVTVKVMVAGADNKAYIYLVDNDTREVLSYSTPSYSYYYDGEGNVLNKEFTENMTEAEHRAAIVYTLRNDGLYDGKDGGVYANFNNLTRSYKYYKYEHNKYFDENGNAVAFKDVVEGQLYYSDFAAKKVANHFLCASNGTRVYEYDNETNTYYYLEKGKRSTAVKPFDIEPRYDIEKLDEKYMVEVPCTNGEWVTVNFIIHTGNEAKNYRLELWSGKRDETGDITKAANGAVAFDYSAYTITSSNYDTVIGEYEKNIVSAYQALILSKKDKINEKYGEASFAGMMKNENIEFYEKTAKKLLDDGLITEQDILDIKNSNSYIARYYTYSLYDSPSYIPFNANTAAEGETGYDYNATEFSEKLAYFEYYDADQKAYNLFADYSAVDQKVDVGTVDDDKDDDEEETQGNSGEVWLLISSILLVIAMFITMISMLLRKVLKDRHRTKNEKAQNKNMYRKRERYIKKLHLVKTETVDEEDGETDGKTEEADDKADEAEGKDETEKTDEAEGSEAPASDDGAESGEAEAPAEETSEEAPAETPAEGTASEAPAETSEAPAEAPADTADGKEETDGSAPAEGSEAPATDSDKPATDGGDDKKD